MEKFLFLMIFILIFAFPITSFAAGFIVIPDALHLGIERAYLPLINYRVNLMVKENVAHIKIDEIFVNPYERQVEGVFLLPLPQGASVNNFSMEVNGKIVKGKIYEKEEARRLYEEIVRKLVDPGLLEYMGKNTYKASIAPILPGKKVKVHIEFTYTLSRIGNTFYVTCPLSGLKYSGKPVKSIVVTGTIETEGTPITNIYSPLYPIEKEIDLTHATFSMEAQNEKPSKDLLIYFTQDIKEVSGTLLTYKEKKEKNGYFMFIISASQKKEKTPVPKDIIVVLDRSGSMAGEKIKQAKEALTFILNRLGKEDRARIITFSSSVHTISPGWIDQEKRSVVKKKVEEIDAAGGTNIYEALDEALSLNTREGTQAYVIFLTDGMPTVGIQDEKKIEELVKEKIGSKRLFVFGIGDDVNLEFLTRLFRYGRGQGEFILGKDIETAISAFYSKIEDPMLTNITLTYPETFYDIYPKIPQDLFWGESITVFGRYEEDPPDSVTIVLRGKRANGENTYTYHFSMRPDEENNFIPELWARRKIGYLLEEIRLNGEKKELVDEIVRLSKKYGIVTPYTSYFIGPEDKRDNTLLLPSSEKYAMAPMPLKRKVVQYEQTLQSADTLSEEGEENTSTRFVGDRVFVRKDDYWVEEGYTEKTQVKTIKMFSDEYFKLLSEDDSLKDILSLGKVIFKYKGEWIKIEK